MSESSNSLAEQLGSRVRRARELRGISQTALADGLGVSQAAVSNLESGSRSLRVEELVAISEILGESLDYFMQPIRRPEVDVAVRLRKLITPPPLPDLREAIDVFLDEVEGTPLPPVTTSLLSDSPEEAAKELTSSTHRAQPPIPVIETARGLGVAVLARPFPHALSALLIRLQDGAVVGVNSHQAATQQRFALAHELGHFILHRNTEHFIDYGVSTAVEGEGPGYDWKSESEANQFAAELLMPEHLLRRDAQSTSKSRLARRYEVSPEAMAFRLANLALE